MSIGEPIYCKLDAVTCPHHWLIEPPAGRTSIGTCRLCGATQMFSNILEYLYNNVNVPRPPRQHRKSDSKEVTQ